MKTRVVLADDHQIMREGLRRLLNDADEFEVVGEAADGRQAVQLVQELSPEVIVMDVRMPDLNGIDATRQIASAHPAARVICLSAHADQKTAGEMLRAGAAGYVVKDSAFEELADAIRTVIRGSIYLSSAVTGVVLDEDSKVTSSGDGSSPSPSTREREVLQLLAEGKSTKQIAMCLGVSTKTIETHRRNLMLKLGIDNIAELTKYAIREGITSVESRSAESRKPACS